MTYIYYLAKNEIPFYIGKTKQLIRRRHHHYNKYGLDITLHIIDECGDNKQIWKPLECYWIEQFKQWGFELINKNNGGGGPTKYTEEQKFKMKKPHPMAGIKISKTLIERNHSKYYTKEIKEKMSLKQKGISKPFSENHKLNISKSNLELKGKIVECYSLINEYITQFNCLREAAEWLLKHKPNISKNVSKQIKDCCNGRQIKCHGYKWKYKDSENSNINDDFWHPHETI